MRSKFMMLLIAGIVLFTAILAWFGYRTFKTGFSAKAEPHALEVFMARQLRHIAIPLEQRAKPNPVPASPEILADARAHFADHCATCHGNNGSGKTPIGENVYPKAPDLRLADTQSMSDGELFFIIHNGIRFTAMPAWGSGDPDKDLDSWKLVHFIRRLPKLTQDDLDEMNTLNPKTKRQIEEELAADRFLQGGDPSELPPASGHRH